MGRRLQRRLESEYASPTMLFGGEVHHVRSACRARMAPWGVLGTRCISCLDSSAPPVCLFSTTLVGIRPSLCRCRTPCRVRAVQAGRRWLDQPFKDVHCGSFSTLESITISQNMKIDENGKHRRTTTRARVLTCKRTFFETLFTLLLIVKRPNQSQVRSFQTFIESAQQ